MRNLALVLLFACAAASAQSFPAKPVKLIVSYPPGGSSDLMARVFGAKLGDLWGQQVIVENKPGAAGAIGTDYAAKQAPDGYAFMIANMGPIAVNPLLSKVPYSVDKDFVPVSLVSTGPNVLVVRTDSSFHSLKDIIDYARANPGKLSYGSSGPGAVNQLAGEMLKNIAKVSALEVPYKGGVLAVQDLLGGQIQFIFSDTLPAMAHVRAGKLRALCTTGSERFALLPDQPPCQDFAPGLVAYNWWALLLPAGTPKPVVDKYHAETVKILADPEVKRKFADLGVDAVSSTPAETVSFIRSEMDKYAKLIKESSPK